MPRTCAPFFPATQMRSLLHQLTADILRTDRPFTGHAQFTPGLLAHTLQALLAFVHIDVGMTETPGFRLAEQSHRRLLLLDTAYTHFTGRDDRTAVGLLQHLVGMFATPVEDVLLAERTHIVEPREGRQTGLVRRNLVHRIHRPRGFANEGASLHLPVLQEHPQEPAFGIVHADLRRILLVHGVIDHEHIAVDIHLAHLSSAEVGHHLLSGHLVVVHGVHLFDGQGLVDDVCPVDGAIVHIDLDFLAQQLLVAAPQDGVTIHRHARILGVIHQRIADRLDIGAPGPHLVIGPHLAPHGVGIEVIRHQPQRVAVHEERVALAIVHGHGALRGQRISGQFVIEAIVAGQHIAVHRIVELDMVERLAIACHPVVEEAIARQLTALVGQDGTVQQLCLLGDGVVGAPLGIDVVIVAHDVRGAQDGGYLGQRTVLQGVRSQHETGIDQFDIFVEDGQFGGRAILAPPGVQDIDRVLQGASLEVIAQVHHAVVVQAIRGEDGLPVDHPHVLAEHGQL